MIFVVTAAIVLLLIELYLRRRPWAMVLAAGIAVIGSVIWFVTEQHSRAERSAVSSVTITVAADAATCTGPALPLAAKLTNGSDASVNRLAFDVIGREPGRTRVAYRGTLRHDRALAPGESIARCYPLLVHGFAHPRPQIIDATKYEWTAHVSFVGFGQAPVD